MNVDKFLKSAGKTLKKDEEITEKYIELKFCEACNKIGYKALKLVFLRKKGFPDRTILCPGGRLFFVEFKRKGLQLSGTQVVVRRMLEKLDFNYYICDDIKDIPAILKKAYK